MVAGTGYDSRGRYVGRPGGSTSSSGGSTGTTTIKGIKSPAQKERAESRGYIPASPGSSVYIKSTSGTPAGLAGTTSATEQRSFATLEEAKMAGAENIYLGSGSKWYEAGALLQPPPYTLAYSKKQGYYTIDVKSGDKREHRYLSEKQAGKMQTEIKSAYARPAPPPTIEGEPREAFAPPAMPWEKRETLTMPKEKLPYTIEKYKKGREVITVSYRENLMDAYVQERVKLGLQPYRRSRFEKGGLTAISLGTSQPVILKNLELERGRRGAYQQIKNISKVEYEYVLPVAQELEKQKAYGIEGLVPGTTGMPRFFESRIGVGGMQTYAYLPTTLTKMPATIIYSIDQPLTATKEYGAKLYQQFKAQPIETIGGIGAIAILGYGISGAYTKYGAGKPKLSYNVGSGRVGYTDKYAISRTTGVGRYKHGFYKAKIATHEPTFTTFFKEKGTVVILHETKYKGGISKMTYTPIKYSSRAYSQSFTTGWYKRTGILAKAKPFKLQTISPTYQAGGQVYGVQFTGQPSAMPTTIGVSWSKTLISKPIKTGFDYKVLKPDMTFHTYQLPYEARTIAVGTYSRTYTPKIKTYGTHKSLIKYDAFRFPKPPVKQIITYRLEAEAFSPAGMPMKPLYPGTTPAPPKITPIKTFKGKIPRTRYDFTTPAPKHAGVGIETVPADSVLRHIVKPEHLFEERLTATMLPVGKAYMQTVGFGTATAVSPALILKPVYKDLQARPPKTTTRPVSIQTLAPITQQAPAVEPAQELGRTVGQIQIPIIEPKPKTPPITREPPVVIPVIEIPEIPQVIVPPFIPTTKKRKAVKRKKKEPVKKKKKKRRPDIAPLADLLSVMQTEATDFGKAVHLPKTKAVKTKYDITFKGRGATMRFPTLQMKKRGIKI